MKKLTSLAFTALLGLAGMASANYSFSVPTGGDFYAGDHSFSFAINDETEVSTFSSAPTVVAAYWSSMANAPNTAMYTVHKKGSTLTLKVGRGSFKTFGNPESRLAFTNSTTFSTDLHKNTVYTISVKGRGANEGGQVVTLSKGSTELETVQFVGNLNGGNVRSNITTYFNQDFDPAKAASPVMTYVLYGLGGVVILGLLWGATRRKK